MQEEKMEKEIAKKPHKESEATGGDKPRKKSEKKAENKLTKVMKVIGYIICLLMLMAGIMTGAYLLKLNVLPMKYMIVYGVVCLVLTLIFFLMQRWLVVGIIAKFLALIVSGLMVVACMYIGYTYNEVQEMVGVVTKVDNIQVYVLLDDAAEDVYDAKDYTYGILAIQDRENTDIVKTEIETEIETTLAVAEYDSVMELMEALYSKEVGAIILNSAYVSFVEEEASYGDFMEKVKSIAYKDIEREIVVEVAPEEVPEEYLYSGDRVFTVYISGIDTSGSPNVTSRSDVNILLTANLDTRQILMISTPRDYYVPLSISGGIRDKLTHAGIYGIDVSKDTLGMLYGVQVDDYVKINFTGFKDIIDELGGVTVWSDYEFSTGGYSYQYGYNELNGTEALVFARCRYAFATGDRQRGKNQMAVIEAVINKMISSDMLYNYTDILDAISDSMITSMSYEEISDLVEFQLNDMQGWDVVSYSVNGYDSSNTTYSTGSQVLYVMVPNEETVEQAKEYLKMMYDGEKIVVEE